MISEVIISESVKAVFSIGMRVLNDVNLKLNSNNKTVSKALENHLKMIRAWSKEVSFKDLQNSRKIHQIYVQLDFFLYPQRIRISKDEIIKKLPLSEIFKVEQNHIVILGQPGAGKTTSMKYICQSFFFENAKTGFDYPLLIKLRELNKPSTDSRSAGLIYDQLMEIFGLKISDEQTISDEIAIRVKRKMIVSILERLKCLLIIEGFDELLYKKHRKSVLDEFSSLATQLTLSRIVLTSRTADYVYSFDCTASFEICALDHDQIVSFSNKWLTKKNEVDKFVKAVYESPFADTAIRPLTIAHLCAIFERSGKIPEKPKTVYRKIINLLLEEWDEQRNISRPSKYADFEVDRKSDFLASLAFYLTTSSKETVFSKKQVESVYSKIHQDFDLPLKESKQVVRELESHSGLFVQAGFEIFEFAHKSLQEYLTADYLVKLPEIPTGIIRLLPNEFAIAVTISSNPSKYFIGFVDLLLNVFGDSKTNSKNRKTIIESTLKKSVYIKTFISRLLLEKPDFNREPEVGLSALKIYSAYLEINDLDHSQLKIFVSDDLVQEFENFMVKISKRNSIDQWLQLYESTNQIDSSNGTIIHRLKIKKKWHDTETAKKIPFSLNCRDTFFNIVHPSVDLRNTES